MVRLNIPMLLYTFIVSASSTEIEQTLSECSHLLKLIIHLPVQSNRVLQSDTNRLLHTLRHILRPSMRLKIKHVF